MQGQQSRRYAEKPCIQISAWILPNRREHFCNIKDDIPQTFFEIKLVFWGISPCRRTLGCYARGAPLVLYVPMFLWKYFFSTKWEKNWGNTKRIVSVRGGSCTCVFSWGLGTPVGSRSWVPLPQENAFVQEPPLQLYSHCFNMPCQIFVRQICHHFLTFFSKLIFFAFYFVELKSTSLIKTCLNNG